MSWLFTIAIVGVCAGVAFTARTIQRQNATVTRRGPVPGYSFTPGAAVDLGVLTRGQGQVTWRITSLEEFHSRDRTRLILSAEVLEGEGEQVRELMVDAARRLRERVPVDLVMVEADNLRLIFSPDGAGWSGEGASQLEFSEVS